MDKGAYLETQNKIFEEAANIKAMRLDEFIKATELADSAGPVLDPTLWRAGKKNLDVILKLARALKDFQDKASEIPDFVEVQQQVWAEHYRNSIGR